MKIVFFIFLLLVFLAPSAFADEAIPMEKIVVTARKELAADERAKQGYPVQILNSAEIKERESNSGPDLLNYDPGVDLRYRGTYGIQADLSVRGGTFEQSTVSIDGIKLNDPQTGHYNLDLPLTVYDIASVDINKTGDSLGYGSGALSGAVDFTTVKPEEKYLKMNVFFGEHALYGQAFSLGLPYKSFSSRLSLEHAISKAAVPNTDFEYYTTSFYLNKDFDYSNIDSFFGYQRKDYGADSFYSNLYPEEEEHTETYFAKTGFGAKFSNAELKNNIFIRRHKDKFILKRNNPTYVNYHTTYIYGLNSGLDLALGQAVFSTKLDAGCELINSTNLGKHSRAHEALSLGLAAPFGQKLNTDLGIRYDHYQKWGGYESYNAGASYDLLKDRLKIKGAYSRSFRLPSFTELYYSDPGNRGDPNLKAESADNFTAGMEFKEGRLTCNFDGFLRRGYNLIDYTRASVNDIWQATNLGRVDFSGIEAGIGFDLNGQGKIFRLKNASFSYAYQTADRKAEGFLSKYALDILQNKLILGVYTGILGMDFNLQLSYNQRYYGKTFIAGDIYLGKKIVNRILTLEPFVSVDNFTNADCVDVAGVLLPGRWVKSGVKFEW